MEEARREQSARLNATPRVVVLRLAVAVVQRRRHQLAEIVEAQAVAAARAREEQRELRGRDVVTERAEQRA